MSIFAAPVYSLEGIVFYRKGNYAKEWIFFEIGKISYSLGKIVLIQIFSELVGDNIKHIVKCIVFIFKINGRIYISKEIPDSRCLKKHSQVRRQAYRDRLFESISLEFLAVDRICH